MQVTKKYRPLQVGDTVSILVTPALQAHAKEVPAHLGYTKEEFYWRDLLRKTRGKKGIITYIPENGVGEYTVKFNFCEHSISIDGIFVTRAEEDN